MDMAEKMELAISEALESSKKYLRQDEGGEWYGEIYADYRDEMDDKTALEILGSDDPELAFWEKLQEWYMDVKWQYRKELEDEIREMLTAEGGQFPFGLNDEQAQMLPDLMEELVYFRLPEDHYMNQEFCVNIMLDTGDGNYDYTLNSVYPAYCGYYNNGLDDKASIVWLTKRLGYTKTQLKQALRSEEPIDYNKREPDGFLMSMRKELVNVSCHMNTLTFLVKMTLREMIELNRLIKLQDRNGRQWDATKNPYCGYIVIEKGTETGLYSPWQGGGSLFEIELEKDIKLPVKFIRSALPDGGDGYSVEGVYGMCESAWHSGAVKTIHAPRKLAV